MSNFNFADPSMVHGWNNEGMNTMETISGNDFEVVRMGAVTTQ
jgi:hypothetical protein